MIPASKQWWYTAPEKQFGAPPVRFTGPSLGKDERFVFIDLAGHKDAESTPVGRMKFSIVGEAFMFGDEEDWFHRYMEAVESWFGRPTIPIFRYANGAYGAKLPNGTLHRAIRAMMPTAWLHGPNREHNAFCMMRIASVCGGNFGVYHGTPAYDEYGVSKIEDVRAVVRAWDRLGARWQGFDYISGYDSTGGEPLDRAFPVPSKFWPEGADSGNGFPRAPRKKLWADDFMGEMHDAAPRTPMCAESGLDPGRAMYESVGMLRMIVPNLRDDGGARYGLKSIERLTGEARDYEVCNPGVPQHNLFDAGESWTPDEYQSAERMIESLPGRQIVGATCWTAAKAGGPNIMDFLR